MKTTSFFLNVLFDRDGEPIIGNGTDRSHFNICMTSKRLIQNLDNNGVHHWDCTYKITIHGYSLLIYGISDIWNRIHLVGFMITSHEKVDDFKHFLYGLARVCEDLEVNFDPE